MPPAQTAQPATGLDHVARPKVYTVNAACRKCVKSLVDLASSAEDPVGEAFRVGSMEVLNEPGAPLSLAGPNLPYHADEVVDKKLARRFIADYKDAAEAVVMESLRQSGQLAYLTDNADALINHEWRVVIDIDIYYHRESSHVEMHRDTKGYTMFFNLIYATEKPVQGPEFIVNPGENPKRLAQISKLMPPRFVQHLREQYAKLPPPEEIETVEIPSGGGVAMVDELIYHSTPYPFHRVPGITIFDVFRNWPEAVAQTYPQSTKAASRSLCIPPPRTLQNETAFMRGLQRIGVDSNQIDAETITKVLTDFPTFARNLVNLCTRPNPYLEATLPEMPGHPGMTVPLPPLKRQLSGKLPPQGADQGPNRPAFVRTWVMGVPRRPGVGVLR